RAPGGIGLDALLRPRDQAFGVLAAAEHDRERLDLLRVLQLRIGLGRALLELERPADARQQVLLELGVLPRAFVVAEVGVEQAALAELAHPADRNMVRLLRLALRHVEAVEDADRP